MAIFSGAPSRLFGRLFAWDDLMSLRQNTTHDWTILVDAGHTNRRRDGAWTQRHEHGMPVAGLMPIIGHNGAHDL